MIRILTLFLFLLMQARLVSIEKLNEKYCVSFGNPNAKNKVIEYYSFSCPHCIALFRKDFNLVKERLIEKGNIYLVFHPIPLDLQTVQAMVCLSKLSEEEKRLFLDAILSEADIEEPKITSMLMQKAMEILKKPQKDLQDKDFISAQEAFQDAFRFLKQEDQIEAIPTAEINGRLFRTEVPECVFIEKHLAKD